MRSAAVLVTLLVMAPALPSQSWRTLTAQRQRTSGDTLHVRVEYGAGRLTLGAASGPLLYDVRLRFDASHFRPEARYDPGTRTLRVGADSATVKLFSLDPRHMRLGGGTKVQASDFTLGLARDVPLDLQVELGAAHADLDLSNLWVARLHLESGASETRVIFGTPNPRPMSELVIDAGVADLSVRQLGNARVQHVVVTTGVGDTELDWGGSWTGDVRVDAHVALGELTLRVPRDAGLMVRVSKRIGDLDAAGLVEKDGAYYSKNWSSATRRITVAGQATLGQVTVAWTD